MQRQSHRDQVSHLSYFINIMSFQGELWLLMLIFVIWLKEVVKFLNRKVNPFALQFFPLRSLQGYHYVWPTPREEEFLFSFLSVGTIMQFAKTYAHGRVTFSPPLIYSWTHGLINVCFIIWATVQKVFCLFWCSKFLVSDIGSSFNRLCLS